MPATGVGAIRQACMKLIRSLLREGVRVRTVTDSGHFLDLVNRHMWGSTTKAWNLNQKEAEDLQKCLKALVKAISERHGTSNDIVLCAPPTPPIDPPENATSPSCSGTDPLQKTRDVEAGPSGARDARNLFKDEPPWIYGEHHDLCGDVKTKKETLSPVPVSDFRPTVELHHLKPDLEKVQEIRSKLSDHNLSKLQNIATTRLEEEQPSECSGLKETRHASNLNSHPTNALSKTPDPVRLSKPFIEKEKPVRWDNDDDDDEPLDVRKRRLKRCRRVPSDSDDQSSDDRHTSVRSSKSVKVNNESGVITISDDEPITGNTRLIGVNLPADNAVNRVTHEPPLDENLNESPSRDFDDLSESQVFEFETQEDVPSVWRDSQIDCPVTKKLKLDTTSKASIGHGAVEATSEFVVETQSVRDEDIEKACQHAEEQISEQKQLQQPVASSLLVPSKPSSSDEKFDNFVKPKSVTAKSPPKKLSLPNKTDKLGMSRKPVIIEPLGQKVKQRSRAHRYVSQDTEKPGCSVTSSSARRSSTPAIVPVKKVRKRIEPELPAELLGLKKKERKAFELSQRTTDTLQELRSHGQNVLIEKNQKTKRVRRNSKTQPKLAGKGGKKLLGSQDMQFFRQSREMLPKTVPSAAGPAPVRSSVSDALPKQKCRPENVEESDEDGDDFFLPCSQPDPDRRTAEENTAGQAVTNASCDANQVEGRETNNKAAQHAESKEDGASDGDDEWTLLTQNEPTDMELCSQMEQMEEAYGTDFFQGDPLGKGADNQPNIFEGSVSVPHKPSPGLVTQKALPATTTQDDQPLFAKPATPPVSQSKAKPSTAKIYTTSSRSASLAEEMGKTPAVPPAANVAKAKHVRPPQPAQHEFRQPLPSRPTPPPRNNHFPVAPTCNKVNLASNPPTYKPYSRPEAPVLVQTPRVNRGQRLDSAKKYDVVKSPLKLKEAVLKWEYRWFENYKQFGPPDDLCPLKLQQVPLTFSSFDEYFSIFYPLLLINLFEEMADQWVNGVKSDVKLWFQTMDGCSSSSVPSAKFTARLTPEQELMQLYPKDDDLVLLLLPENAGAYAHDESVSFGFHFGCVTQQKVINNRGGQPTNLEVTIQTYGNVSSINSTPVHCKTIGSMVTALREFRALFSAKDTMEKPLLTLDVRYFTPCQEGLPKLDMPEYNRDQAKAIAYGFAMVKRKIMSPKILLIHGPPGTGKSKTIAGLLHRLLTDSQSRAVNHYGKPRRMRFLVCAPSNAAIDNLMKKIIVVFKHKANPQGNCGDINLVRVGSEKTIAKGLQRFSHESQIKNRMEKLQISSNMDIHRKRGELDKLIDQLSLECAKAKQDKNMTQFEMLNARKQQYNKERETLSSQLKKFRDTKQEIQTRLLIEANIICCTLSKSGSVVIDLAFRQLGHEPFSCVIVDEAGQAKETETLIPLRFRCPSLILVGDSEQLRPTVISQKAKELGFDQSLMARVWKSLENSNHRPPPTVFLSMQYRMHPDICEFPSKYIYGNNLKNAGEMAQKCCSARWPFEPYRVFDVTDGRESKEGDSFINQKEVTLVVLLVKLLRDKRQEKTRIGVITPYNAQKRRIIEALSTSIPSTDCTQSTVEVDTVDGFQGREMECIIVSCVRAGNEMGSIGFVGNRQRMNVTITRAKFSLFILGHIRTLKEQSDWGALIDDAAKRGYIISTAEHVFPVAIQEVLKPVRLSRSYSHPPDHVSTPSTSTSSAQADSIIDRRPSSRNLDPRISKTNEAHRERDRGNRSRSHSRPPSRHSTDSRRNQSSTHSSRSPSDPRLERFPFSSLSSRPGR